MTQYNDEVNNKEYPTDVAGECVVARVFVAKEFMDNGLMEEAKFCLEQVTNVFPEPREQFLEAAFASAIKRAKELHEAPPNKPECFLELIQGGRE